MSKLDKILNGEDLCLHAINIVETLSNEIQCILLGCNFMCFTDDLWFGLLSVLLIGNACCILQLILIKKTKSEYLCVEFTLHS